MIYLLCIPALIYTLLILKASQIFGSSENTEAQNDNFTAFSILIPFRNEHQRITPLLVSLTQLKYPITSFEIVFVDDHSDDNTSKEIIRVMSGSDINYKILLNTGQGKKQALNLAIESAQNEWVVTTDADCIVPGSWLSVLNDEIHKLQPEMLAGPVVYYSDKPNFTSFYQVVENAGLIVFSAAAIKSGFAFTANGANLCFKKQSFFDVGGYTNNLHIASGDDEFLLEKFVTHFPRSVHFVDNKLALVKTTAESSFRDFLNQRIRWAGKTKHRHNWAVYVMQVSLFLWFLGILICIPAGFFYPPVAVVAIISMFVKNVVDISFYQKIRNFFGLQLKLPTIVLISLSQLVIIPIVAFATLRGKVSWRGRVHRI